MSIHATLNRILILAGSAALLASQARAQAPQLVAGKPQLVAPGLSPALSDPTGLAVVAGADAPSCLVADRSSNPVVILLEDGEVTVDQNLVLPKGVTAPYRMGGGDPWFVSDGGASAIYFEYKPGMHYAVASPLAFSAPTGLWLDTNDNNNLYVADSGSGRVLLLSGFSFVPAQGTATAVAQFGQAAVVASGYTPVSVGADDQGNVYFLDSVGRVFEAALHDGTYQAPVQLQFSAGPERPISMAVTPFGGIYLADPSVPALWQELPDPANSGNYLQSAMPIGSAVPSNVAVDPVSGFPFFTDTSTGQIYAIPFTVDFGAVNPGTTSQTFTLTLLSAAEAGGYTVSATTDTAGGHQANLDFQVVGVNGATNPGGKPFTVDVAFTPTQSGFRSGTLLVQDAYGDNLCTLTLTGTGSSGGPPVAFIPPAPARSLLSLPTSAPGGLVVDAQGDLAFLNGVLNTAGTFSWSLMELKAGASATVTVPMAPDPTLNAPTGLAQDGKGDFFITDPSFTTGQSRLIEVTPDGTATVLDNTLGSPNGVAVDAHGNLFVVDPLYPSGGITVCALVEEPASTDSTGNYTYDSSKRVLLYSGSSDPGTLPQFYQPEAVTVDSNGIVFVYHQYFGASEQDIAGMVSEFTQSSPSWTRTTVVGNLTATPFGLAADPVSSGSLVYIADDSQGIQLAIPSASSSGGWQTLNLQSAVTGTGYNGAMAVDVNGNLFFGQKQVILAPPSVSGSVSEIDFADPPVLTLASATKNTPAPPQTLSIVNIGGQDVTLIGSSSTGASASVPAFSSYAGAYGFAVDASSTFQPLGASTQAVTLQPGGSTSLAIDFTPTVADISDAWLYLGLTLDPTNPSPTIYPRGINLVGNGPAIPTFSVTPGSDGSVTVTLDPPGAATYAVVTNATDPRTTATVLAGGKIVVQHPFHEMNMRVATSDSNSALLNLSQAQVTVAEPVTFTFGNQTPTYTGAALAATCTASDPNAQGLVQLSYLSNGPDGTSYPYPTSPIKAGSYTVTATVVDPNSVYYAIPIQASFNILQAPVTVTLSNLSQVYTGGLLVPTVTLTVAPSVLVPPSPSAYRLTWTPGPALNVGPYQVEAAVTDPNFTNIPSFVPFTVNRAHAAITILPASLEQTYTGAHLPVTVSTRPPNLHTIVTYDGSPIPPIHPSPRPYLVLVVVRDPNAFPSFTTGWLTIAKATATVTVGAQSKPYTGRPVAASVGTTPPNLPVVLSYTQDHRPVVPRAVGTYTVTATVVDRDWQGSGTGTLTIHN